VDLKRQMRGLTRTTKFLQINLGWPDGLNETKGGESNSLNLLSNVFRIAESKLHCGEKALSHCPGLALGIFQSDYGQWVIK